MTDTSLSQRETAILLLLMAEAREFTNPELKEQFGFEIEKKEREHLELLKLIDVGKRGQAFTYTLSEDGWGRAIKLFSEGIPKSTRLAPRLLEAVVRAMVSGLQRHMARTDVRLAEIFGREEDFPQATAEAPADRPSTSEATAPKAETTSEPIAQPPIAQPPIAQSPIPQPPVAQPSVAETPTTETSISETPTAQPPIVETPPASVPALSSEDIETLIRKAYAQLADMPNTWVSLTQLRPLLGDAPRDKVDATLVEMTRRPDVRFVPWENQKTLTQADRDAAVVIGDQPKHRIWIGA
ncbi:hypothetical protein [Microbispora hainanensis]|uniref:hypothetical protein n=1 Tax=Microbispora hainanensis TaxID=568844 RepID=UPI003251D8AB